MILGGTIDNNFTDIVRLLTSRFLFLDGASVTTGAGNGNTGGRANVSTNASDAYRQSSSASPRGVVSNAGGGYCGSSASTPHSHSTTGSYSVANPYTGSPTLYTSRKYLFIINVFNYLFIFIYQATFCIICMFSRIKRFACKFK